MTLAEKYQANYDRIAHDHVSHWKVTGSNPFMPDGDVQAFNENTRYNLRAFVPAGSKIFDAGCGMGDLLAGLPEYERHGADIADEYLEVARTRGIDAIHANLEELPYPDATFDAVTACDVLEHVLDLNAVLRELLRVLKPGGILITRSPNCEDLWGYVNYTVYDFVHLRRFDEPGLRLMFTRIFGCEVIGCPVIGTEIGCVVRKP